MPSVDDVSPERRLTLPPTRDPPVPADTEIDPAAPSLLSPVDIAMDPADANDDDGVIDDSAGPVRIIIGPDTPFDEVPVVEIDTPDRPTNDTIDPPLLLPL